jgi:lipopolysaccharide export system permease protein
MAATLISTFALLVFEDMYREFPGLLTNGIGGILRHYLQCFPHFFCTVLPISVFISALISLCSLRNNNEFIAMQAAGLSPWQITKNIWLCGIAISIIMIFLQAHLDERPRDANYYNLFFRDSLSGRVWLVGHLNAANGQADDIFILDPGPPLRRFHAQSARWDGRHWDFQKITASNVAIPWAEGNRHFNEKFWDEFHEAPRQIINQQKRPKDMCLRELRQAMRVEPKESPRMRAYRVRFHVCYTACFAPFVALFCAIPFSLYGVRQNPMHGASKAIGLLFLFHVILGLSSSLGNNGVLHPMVAAWLPFFLPISIGVLCLRYGSGGQIRSTKSDS